VGLAVVLCGCGLVGYDDIGFGASDGQGDGDGGTGAADDGGAGPDADFASLDAGTATIIGSFPTGLAIATGAASSLANPHLVYDGGGYGIVYEQSGDGVYFLRISDTGGVTGPIRVSAQNESGSAVSPATVGCRSTECAESGATAIRSTRRS